MVDLWTTLVPLVIGSAIVPVQILITVLLVRNSLRTASAWVAGMAAVRLAQGVLFGFVFYQVVATSGSAAGPGIVGSSLLLVLSVLFYVTALRKALADRDAPPPKWMDKVGSLSSSGAFGAGSAYVAVAPKFWVFTLGAIGAIADAKLGAPASVLAFLAFVVLALSGNLAILAFAAVAPGRAATALDGFADALKRRDRVITVVLGVVFGTWFLVKALSGFGIV